MLQGVCCSVLKSPLQQSLHQCNVRERRPVIALAHLISDTNKHTATDCNTLHCTATASLPTARARASPCHCARTSHFRHIYTHCNTLHFTVLHCNSISTHCTCKSSTLPPIHTAHDTATHYIVLQHYFYPLHVRERHLTVEFVHLVSDTYTHTTTH